MHSLHLHSTLPIIILFVPPQDSSLPVVQMRRWLELAVANSLPYQEGLRRIGCVGFYPALNPFYCGAGKPTALAQRWLLTMFA